ncbi:hypothetical protein [Sphingobacterium sp. 2149]|uniref:hypothetical protein n=1 Tax=Sphingobacterium sp. 2149 TaxID=2817763 RepID=UPI0028605CB9|nr:hypothetical protein [Sphingobacterium sp. 2149]MDR6734222.1 hypothetical protein [Sphingobacterium sp. 2149]
MGLIYFGSVKDGALKIRNKNALVLDLQSLEGKEIEIRISKKKKTRSNEQNRYYWGVVVPIVKQGLIDAGYSREKINNSEVIHELLKSMFCPKEELINEDTGEILFLPPTTTSNSTSQMMDYFEDIKRWCAENIGVYIPDPNEQTSLFAE